MRALLGKVISVGGFFSFHHIKYILPLPSGLQISAEKSASNLIRVPLYVICFFSLAAFNIFSLSLILVSLINMCLGVFLLGFILYGTRCASRIWVSGSFPMLRKFSAIISWNIFSVPFPLSYPSGTPIIWMLVHLTLSQSSLRLSSFVFNLFSLFCSAPIISTNLSSASLIRSSASCILLLAASNEASLASSSASTV